MFTIYFWFSSMFGRFYVQKLCIHLYYQIKIYSLFYNFFNIGISVSMYFSMIFYISSPIQVYRNYKFFCTVVYFLCLFREYLKCINKSLEYSASNQKCNRNYFIWKRWKRPTNTQTNKMEIKVPIKQLVQTVEEALPSYLQHVAIMAHQYQVISHLNKCLDWKWCSYPYWLQRQLFL